MQLHVDLSAVKEHARRLQQIGRSALPVAVRQTLNSAAFDVKQRTMPGETADTFIQRKPNFFKANSKVEQAKGFDIGQMKATVGFVPPGGKNQAVNDLEQQEHGGQIEGRSFIPTDAARTGGSNRRMVKANARLKGLKFVNPRNVGGKNKRQRFIKSVVHAGKGGLVLGQLGSRQVIWRVNSLTRTADGNFKLTPLYTYKKGRAAKIDNATHFMRTASTRSAGQLNNNFLYHAQKQIDKLK